MLTVAFFNHGFLVEREVIKALRALPQVRLVVVSTAPFSNAEQARFASQILADQHCNILFSINDHGMDFEGILADFLKRNSIVHVNWCVDDPFFLETFNSLPLKVYRNRFDFVSDRGYVEPLRQRGVRAFFLPLASDTEIFFPNTPALEIAYGVSFVGNSYVAGLGEMLKGSEVFIEDNLAFVNECNQRYRADIRSPLEGRINQYVAGLTLAPGLTPKKAAYLIKHFVGYLYRKKTVSNLVERFDSFSVIGDQGWETAIPRERIVRGIGYYLGLNETYQKTAVNIDINRVVIRDGFTQRVFDCLASGSFIVTSPKAVVSEFFQTSGPDQEIAVFDNEESLFSQIDYFLKHTQARRDIALRGQKKVLGEHTYHHRIGNIFKILQQELGKI